MERRSLLEYFDNFLRLGRESAYIQRRGYRSVRWTYCQVAETAFQFAHELSKRGIGKGDCVLLWGPNSAEWVASFFGCVLRGAIVVPMDDAAAPDFALRVYQQVNAKLLVCLRRHEQPSIPGLILEDLQETLAHYSSAPIAPPPINTQDTLEIVFTSGATAEPKGVVITHGNVLANIEPLETEIQKYMKYERLVHPIRFLSLLPLSHVFGQFLGIFLPQLMGAAVIFHDTLNPSEVIAMIRRQRVSVLVAVPRVLQSLREKIERSLDPGKLEDFRRRFETAKGKHFLRRWWIFRSVHRQLGWKFWAFISGGAALDSQTEEFWGRLGYAVIQGYGLTETTSIISVNHPFRLGKGSIGKVLAGRDVKLAPDGEILVRGAGVASGYWNGCELQPIAGAQGWYPTGDIGELDAEGNLYFKGRKKDVIVTPAGMNVYPEDLEAALRRQPEVKLCVVIPLPRDGNAEPCAVMILRDRGLDPAPIVKRANENLAEYQRMNSFFVWPEEDFPRTSTQKPRTNLILQTVQAELKTKGGDHAIAGPLRELIARVKHRSEPELSPQANLESDLNLSSLDRVELLSALEDRYQIDLSETRFAAVNTVEDLERILHGRTPSRARYHYPRWVQRWPVTWVRLIAHYLLLRPAIFLLGWPRVEGREKLTGVQAPVVVICNHISDVDVG
ncbi:MAG TPA: AMP-binding protein, partial [Terriglobales bacterium]|nr:AMP-binding protein [Terriglobales bacterium]